MALVTGGGTGIGRGIALALAKRNVSVALVGRRREPLATTARELRACGVQAVAIPADLTDTTALHATVAQVQEQLGPIDTLVHNAAVLAEGELGKQTPASIANAVATNLTAPIALTQLLLPDLIVQRGRIVLIGSTTSFVPLPYLSLYAATKAGLHHFGETLRHEVQPHGVQLLTAYPPATATPMTAAMMARMGRMSQRWPFRPATPEAIGDQIIQALVAGKRECIWWGGEHLLRRLYQFAPGLTARLLYTQRRQFARMVEHG